MLYTILWLVFILTTILAVPIALVVDKQRAKKAQRDAAMAAGEDPLSDDEAVLEEGEVEEGEVEIEEEMDASLEEVEEADSFGDGEAFAGDAFGDGEPFGDADAFDDAFPKDQ